MVHVAGVLWLAWVVVRDVRDPACDPVRTDPAFGPVGPGGLGGPGGQAGGYDDPGGGVLDGAPDRMAGRAAGPRSPSVWLGFAAPSGIDHGVEPGRREADLAGHLFADPRRHDPLGDHDQADAGVRGLMEPQPLPAEPER